ncbi:MAG: ABC transporter permease subunit [Firmicutes bacterium]|nr:ABC transporter permease subunit [Bacillota bacterium]
MNRALGGAAALVLLFLFLPVGILLMHAGQFFAVLRYPGNVSAMFVTLASGLVALAIDVALGVPLAWVLARRAKPLWQRIWGTALIVPLLMPPLVIGLVLAYIVGPASPIGNLLDLTNTFAGLVLAEVYESLPFFVFTSWGYVRTIPRSLEEDVWVLGKSPADTFRFVLWPIARTGFAVAAAMAWARIVGAFGAPIVVAYHPSALPVAIWIQLEETGLPAALGLALWLVVISLPLPVWLNWRASRVERLR